MGFGTWEMSTTSYGEIDVKRSSNAVAAALERGVTLFDTVEVYGPYHSEELLAKARGPRRQELTLVIKVGFAYDDEPKIVGRYSTYAHAHVIERTEGACGGSRLI